jgi:PKD repeat protein
MKKLFLPVIFLMLFVPGMSQGWVYISGTVTDSLNGYPIVNHPVTIMSDSTNGVFYYNVVLTDSAGHYYDDVPVMTDTTGILFVQTIDCNGTLHQFVIIYNPVNNNFTQDFQICTQNIQCEANFTYYDYGDGTFEFTDMSPGNPVTWYWEFGDGGISTEKNPFHAYPGPGTYNTCLTITGNDCTDTFCQTIAISDTVYQQLYGQVFSGNFPAQQGIVQLFAMNPNGGYVSFGDACQLDSNGVFYFTLVPEGIYLIQAVPLDSSNYLPTYFGDVLTWQQAIQVVIGVPDNPYNISLVAAGLITPGPGSCSGQISNVQFQRSAVDKINMMLMDESFSTIGFSEVSGSGAFEFASMDFGIYYLRAELSGVSSDVMQVEIIPERPHMDVYLTFNGNSILGTDDKNLAEALAVYPNPVSDRLNISFNLPGTELVVFEMYNMNGQLVYQAAETANNGQNMRTISVSNLPSGIYTLRLSSENGLNMLKKVVKTR